MRAARVTDIRDWVCIIIYLQIRRGRLLFVINLVHDLINIAHKLERICRVCFQIVYDICVNRFNHAYFTLAANTCQHRIHIFLVICRKMLPRLASVKQDFGNDTQELGQNLLIQSNLLELLVR